MNNITTAEYHLQTNCQDEHFNWTVISKLRHYVSEHQTDWRTYMLPLSYSYLLQVIGSTSCRSSAWSTCNPPGPAWVLQTRVSLSSVDDLTSPMYSVLGLIRQIMDLWSEADNGLELA